MSIDDTYTDGQRTTPPATARHERAGVNGERRTVNGQRPFIPYARQWIDEEDIQAVVEVLHSDWLTTGPKVAEFEKAFINFVGAKEAVAVNNGTAALHAAMYAIGIGLGDEVILSPMTFVATANAMVFQGGTPVFADVDPDTLLIDPTKLGEKITKRTKAIVAVDYAGQPCDYDALREIAERHSLILVADACHSLGAEYKGRNVGTLADLTVFSFHPVKHITTGEGGMVVTDNTELANRMRMFRNHGITRNPEMFTPARQTLGGVHPCPPRLYQDRRGSPLTETQQTTDNGQRIKDNNFQQATVNGQRSTVNEQWYYEMQDFGYNYRITDIQCALGLSQLKKLPEFLRRRCEIAAKYDEALADIPGIEPLGLRSDVMPAKHLAKHQTTSDIHSSSDAMRHVYPVESLPNGIRSPFHRGEGHSTGAPRSMPSKHAYHLYVIKVDFKALEIDRTTVFQSLREKGIGVNVHYIPVHLHPFYRKKYHTGLGLCPVAEAGYEQIISLPMFPAMTDPDIETVVDAISTSIY